MKTSSIAAAVVALVLSAGLSSSGAIAAAAPPLPAASPKAATTKKMVVTGDTVNIRSKPNGTIVDVAYKGQTLSMGTKTSGVWRQLANGRWISSAYLKTPKKKAAKTSSKQKKSSSTSTWKASIRQTTSAEVKHTYRPGCPVGPRQLSTITMTYRDFSGDVNTGQMIVHTSVAKQVRDAFKDAFDGGYRIYQMVNPNKWKGNDIKMMAANNTSAFNCRQVTGNAARLSPHSFGKSIDINPVQNPYRVGGRWYPHATYATHRPTKVTGMLHSGSPMVKALRKRGFDWFSGWDWQHFQK